MPRIWYIQLGEGNRKKVRRHFSDKLVHSQFLTFLQPGLEQRLYWACLKAEWCSISWKDMFTAADPRLK
jgi:hypothetical protein